MLSAPSKIPEKLILTLVSIKHHAPVQPYGSDDEVSFKINKNYANRYDTWRQKEELQKLKDRYGERAVKNGMNASDDSSSSEDEFGNADQLPEQFEKDFFKTLSCLKKKDPRIYDKDTAFFNDTPVASTQKQAKNPKNDEKPMFLRDYERKIIVEREGKLSEDGKFSCQK
ncbi:hypothetical protein C0J52_08099 [Blattella germanica]|nr:hypothetical protein C0J52_08099 [Blattella germanica]